MRFVPMTLSHSDEIVWVNPHQVTYVTKYTKLHDTTAIFLAGDSQPIVVKNSVQSVILDLQTMY